MFFFSFWLNLPLFVCRTEATAPTPEMSPPPRSALFWKEIGLTTLTTSDYSHNSPCEEIKGTSFSVLPCQHTARRDLLWMWKLAQPRCLFSLDFCFINTRFAVGDTTRTSHLSPSPCADCCAPGRRSRNWFIIFFFLVEVQECRTCNGRIQCEVVSVLTSVVPHVSASYTALMQAFLCFGLNLLIHKA